MTVPWFDQQAERQEMHRAACRWIAELILNEAPDVYAPADARFWIEVARIRDAMAAAGAIVPAAPPEATIEGEKT